MYSNASYSSASTSGGNQESRPSFPHSHSHNQHGGSQFTVAGMSAPAAAHSPSLRASTLGSGPLGMSMGSSLGESRSHYQPGYLMSVAQNNTSPQNTPRHEEVPIVHTKAKLNHVAFANGSASDFGMDSMFESSRQRQRQTLADEDAPPTNSVNDIPNEIYSDSPARFQPRESTFEASATRSLFRSTYPSTPTASRTQNAPPADPLLYVIVFGYPPDKYSVTVEYFSSLGESSQVEPGGEIINAFKIGYANASEAMRAVRKNGDVLGGEFMVGAKWADPAQAEALLGSSLVRGFVPSPEAIAEPPSTNTSPFGAAQTRRMSVDEPGALVHSTTPTVGTPIRLAPSVAAFRRPGAGGGTPRSGPPTSQKPQFAVPLPVGGSQSPSKSVIGQVSDLIFGW